jgi:hypothetical protein
VSPQAMEFSEKISFFLLSTNLVLIVGPVTKEVKKKKKFWGKKKF